MTSSSDIAFTPTVKAIQSQRGSRASYARMEQKGGWPVSITDDLATFLTKTDSFYFGTANAAAQPYIQHRGGPPGFLHVLDQKTLAFADFRGNRQYITVGNLKENPRAFIFVMDYATRHRVKIWGSAEVIEQDTSLIARVFPSGYRAKAEQAIVFTVAAWDVNCPQHIPHKIAASHIGEQLARYQARIAELEAKLATAEYGSAEDRQNES
jgi:predicted pyridoxine 5'-phosphate oxidase superfamily flavin-nucleotide-binding protein